MRKNRKFTAQEEKKTYIFKTLLTRLLLFSSIPLSGIHS
jgi:hypothetical protein